MDILDSIFPDWTPTAIVIWALISFGIVYVVWFVEIPSLVGDEAGFPTIVKYGVTIFIPVITWYLIHNKEWTAEKFGKIGKNYRQNR